MPIQHRRRSCSDRASQAFDCAVRADRLDVAWVAVAGELDIAAAPRLEQALRDAAMAARVVVVDLRDLTFIDCSGIRPILDGAIRARQTGARLLVARGPSPVDRVFMLTGISKLVHVVELARDEPQIQALLQAVLRDQEPVDAPALRIDGPRPLTTITERSRAAAGLTAETVKRPTRIAPYRSRVFDTPADASAKQLATSLHKIDYWDQACG